LLDEEDTDEEELLSCVEQPASTVKGSDRKKQKTKEPRALSPEAASIVAGTAIQITGMQGALSGVSSRLD
jgi:hypothetical protein